MRLHNKVAISDKGHLKRSMLTKEQKKEDFYSADRLKVILPGQSSEEGRLRFPPAIIEKLSYEAKDTLTNLIEATRIWNLMTQSLGTRERCVLARDVISKSADKALLKDIDTKGLGLHFKEFPSRIKSSEEDSEESVDLTQSPVIKPKSGQGDRVTKLLYLAISNPSLVTILRRVQNRASGAELFKKFNQFVESFTIIL